MSHDDTGIGPIDTTEEMRQMAPPLGSALLITTSGLCVDCERRKAEDQAAAPGVVGSGGWCAPSAQLYGIDPSPQCFVVEPVPFEDFLPHRKRIKRKRVLKAFRRWERHNEIVGTVSHGYYRLSDLFPKVSVQRGGITFGTSRR